MYKQREILEKEKKKDMKNEKEKGKVKAKDANVGDHGRKDQNVHSQEHVDTLRIPLDVRCQRTKFPSFDHI